MHEAIVVSREVHSRTAPPRANGRLARGASCLPHALRGSRPIPATLPKTPRRRPRLCSKEGLRARRCAPGWSNVSLVRRWTGVCRPVPLEPVEGDCNAQTLTRSQVRNPRRLRPGSSPARATRPLDCRPLRTCGAENFSLRAAARTRPARRAAGPPLLTQSHFGACPKVLA